MQNNDIIYNNELGNFTFRVGAIIINKGRLLMIKHVDINGYYSVGGKVKLNETTEQAVIRETYEETNEIFEIEKLAFVHEYLYNHPTKQIPLHEIAFYYLMKQDSNITFYNGNKKESLHWIALNDLPNTHLYPTFFKTKLLNGFTEIEHIVSRL